MKKWNKFILIAAVTMVDVSLPAQTSKASASGQLTDNVVVLSSPRYREDRRRIGRTRCYSGKLLVASAAHHEN
jgi:hypothetical protein